MNSSSQEPEKIYNQLPCGYHSLDKNGNFVRINDIELQMLGYSREEVIDRNFADFITPESLPTFKHNFPIFKQRGWVNDLELQMRCKDGTILPIALSATAIKDPAGNFLMINSVVIDISERKKIEAEQRQAEIEHQKTKQQLQAILDNSPAVIYLIDSQNRHLLVNRSYAQLLSTTSEELLGKSIYDVWSKETADIFAANNRRVLLENRMLETEEVVPQSDGLHTYISLKFPIYNTDGIPYAVGSISTDITERKRTELELRNSEAKASSLTNDVIDKSPVGVFILDADFRVVWLNQILEKFFGLRKEKIIGQDKRQLIRQHIAQIFESPELFTKTVLDTYDNNTYIEKFECHVLPEGDRKERWLEHLSQPILSGLYAGGRIEHYTDITERILSEQKIREQATLIDIASDAIFVRDLSNRILFWSRGAERMSGWTKEEIINRVAQEIFDRESSSQLEQALATTLEEGSWNGELKQLTKDNREIIVESRWTLVPDAQGNPQSILVVNTNITEKKQLERQLLHAQRLESIGTLAGGIAHDLNNILTPILGFAQLLPLKIPNLDRASMEMLELIRANALRGANIVRQVLMFARETETEWKLVSISQLLEEIIQLIRQTFPKSIAIEDRVSPDLWQLDGDSSQLHQLLMNLCINARDAMPDGGKLIISAENLSLDEQYSATNLNIEVGNYILITVTDTGMGIPPDTIDRIFEPFFTTKEPGRGTGLGLSMVMGIAKNHGGTIEVKSDLRSGTQFEVYLPVSAAIATTETITGETLPSGRGELILVVDDEAGIREVTKATLETHNYRVITASDGLEAIAIYAQQPQEIRVVLMDLVMPEMDGLTAMRALKKINPKVKLIANSGIPTKEKVSAAESIGIQAFLLKPYTAEKLLFHLNQAIVAQ
ncbi:MAG: PAS domain S-box protein [Xenococcaceae cyanobacterium]